MCAICAIYAMYAIYAFLAHYVHRNVGWWKWPPISCSSSDKAATINRRVILLLQYISNDINRPLTIFCYHNSRVGTKAVLPRKDEGPDRKGLLLTEDICFNMRF